MENNLESVSKMLADLKTNKLSPARVEGMLGFSNGLLGKAAKGKTTLSENKFTMLAEYYKEYYAPLTKIEITKSTPESFDGKKNNLLNQDEPVQYEKPINIEDVEFVILKDGIKRRITKEVVVLLIQKYFPNEFKEASEPNQSSMNGDVLSMYQSEINDNLGYPDFLKNNIAPRIREDNNLTAVQKIYLLSSFGAK